MSAIPMPDCRSCEHPAEDHVNGMCLHTLECLCTGYEVAVNDDEEEYQEDE